MIRVLLPTRKAREDIKIYGGKSDSILGPTAISYQW